MNDARRELELDFAFGSPPRDEEAAARFRLAELRRSAAARTPRRAFFPRSGAARHVLWRDGVARIREV